MITYYYRNLRGRKLTSLTTYKPGAWVYVESPSEEELEQLAEKFELDPGALKDAIDEDEMPRMEREDKVTYMFTRFPFMDRDNVMRTMPLLFVVGENLFMTVSLRPFARLERFTQGRLDFHTTQRTKLLLQIMSQIVDQYDVFLNNISRQIKVIRSRLRVEEIRNRDFVNFVQIEDELNEFLTALTPTNAILRRLLIGKHMKLFEEDKDLIEDLLLNNEQSMEDCNSNLKTIINIREAYSTIMSNNLNQTIRVLTLVTIMLEVPTLIASIFGMNVPVPFAHSPIAFFGIVLSLALTVLLLAILFRRQRWL